MIRVSCPNPSVITFAILCLWALVIMKHLLEIFSMKRNSQRITSGDKTSKWISCWLVTGFCSSFSIKSLLVWASVNFSYNDKPRDSTRQIFFLFINDLVLCHHWTYLPRKRNKINNMNSNEKIKRKKMNIPWETIPLEKKKEKEK